MAQLTLELAWTVDGYGDIVVELTDDYDTVLAEVTLDHEDFVEALVEDLATPDADEFSEAVEDWRNTVNRLRTLADRLERRIKDYLN